AHRSEGQQPAGGAERGAQGLWRPEAARAGADQQDHPGEAYAMSMMGMLKGGQGLSEASQEVIRKSMDFEASVISMVKRSERRAWIVAMVSLFITVCLVAAIVYMLPLKEKI